MAGPFTDPLVQLEGPAVLWESQPYVNLLSGGGHDFGLFVGQNRGWIGAYFRCVTPDATDGTTVGDMLQYHPNFTMPVGSPGGSVTMRVSPGRVRSRCAQGIYTTRPAGGGTITPDGDPAYTQVYRGVLASGLGPYVNGLRGAAPAGPILGGETQEFAATGSGRKDVPNREPIEPFMWTLFGRCLVADMGYAPGEIVALTSSRGSGTVRGWGTSYSAARNMFTLGEDTVPFFIGKAGASSTLTPARWSLFFRFIGTPKGGLYGSPNVKEKMLRRPPLRLWQSPPVQHSAGLEPVTFAMPEDFTPFLVNGIQICSTPELGFAVGDWCVANEGDSSSTSYAGYSVAFEGRNCTISPADNQCTHSFLNGANAALTAANWSWSVVFVG